MPIRTSIPASISAFVVVTFTALTGACLDWGAFGDGPGGDGGREGEGNEGEGAAAEGEGAAAEGEGEGGGLNGPKWISVDAPITAQAELAAVLTTQLSSSKSRLFAVGQTHIFELIDDALEPIAELAVPCTDAVLTGPVAVDDANGAGSGDLLVGTVRGAVRFHDDGSCDTQYDVGVGIPSNAHAITAFHDGCLVFTGAALSLFALDGTVVDDHAFDAATRGAFFDDAGGGGDSIVLVRGGPQAPGQALRITMPSTELVVEVVGDSVDAMAGGKPLNTFIDTSLGAPFLDVVDVTDPAAPVTNQVRVASEDSVTALATDDGGEVAVVGPSALVAHVDLAANPSALTSVTGARFGAIQRIVVGKGGEVWGVGANVLLFWTPASALAGKQPDTIKDDVDVNSYGPLVAVGTSLFYSDSSQVLRRADAEADGSSVDVVQIIDSVSFDPVTLADYQSRFAFLPAGANAASEPARLVEAGSYAVVAYELDDDLGAVTSRLAATGAFPFSSVTAVAILDDASKAVYAADFSSVYTCNIDLPAGQTPVVTCGSPRAGGVSNAGAITVIDPSPGVDDETYVLSAQNVVSIMEPGETGRAFTADIDAGVHALLINDCIMTFSSGRGWSAVDQAQPLSPSERRGFNVYDVAAVGDRIFVAGDGGGAGQLATVPVPATSTCNDANDAPVLDGAAMLGGEVRSQTSLRAAAFVDGELFVLDVDGLLWHVPTP